MSGSELISNKSWRSINYIFDNLDISVSKDEFLSGYQIIYGNLDKNSEDYKNYMVFRKGGQQHEDITIAVSDHHTIVIINKKIIYEK